MSAFRFGWILLSILMLGMFSAESFAASAHSRPYFKKVKKGSAKKKRVYPSLPHNPFFQSTCVSTLPTVYNPSRNNTMQGGKKNRFTEYVRSVEDAIRSGNPVTVAMDHEGPFGSECSNYDRRCLLLVHLPGLNDAFPEYRQAFPLLPKDSILAIVEDTGGAFEGKGTGKLDLPFRNGFYVESPFRSARFEILSHLGYSRKNRDKDLRGEQIFPRGLVSKCVKHR